MKLGHIEAPKSAILTILEGHASYTYYNVFWLLLKFTVKSM